MVLEFQAVLDENNTIQLPDEIVEQLQHAQKLHFTVVPVIEKPVEDMTPDEAWQATLDFVRQRMATAKPSSEPYKWNRDELYDHLEK